MLLHHTGHYEVNVFYEAHFEHFIGLVQDDTFNLEPGRADGSISDR